MTDTAALPQQVRSLIACGGAALHGASVPDTVAIDQPADLVEYAQRHGMVTWLPPPVGAEARRAHAARALAGIRTLTELAAAFRSAGIAAVWLKGPVLSAWLYGDPAVRRFGDLDALISPRDRKRASAVLEGQGYRRVIPGRAGAVIFAGLGAWPFDRAGDVRIDLHWRPAARRFPQVVDPTAGVSQAVTIDIAGHEIATPRPAHSAALVLAHAAKHFWYALESSLSVARLTLRRDVDWDEVRQLIARAGALRAASAGLRLASELFDTVTPAPFGSEVQEPHAIALCRWAYVALALPPHVFPDRALERRMHRLAFDAAPKRLTYDVRRLLEPTQAEWAWVKLPDTLAPLYVPVRLVRLMLARLRIIPR